MGCGKSASILYNSVSKMLRRESYGALKKWRKMVGSCLETCQYLFGYAMHPSMRVLIHQQFCQVGIARCRLFGIQLHGMKT